MNADIKQYLKLKAALLNEKSRIEARLAEIAKVLNGDVGVTAAPTGKRGGARNFSDATKAKMAAAQKARWAKLKGKAAVVAASAPAPKKKRKMSPAGRAAIIAATKARWAKIKAQKAAAVAKPVKASK